MKLRQNVALADYTSLHAGGSAERLAELEPGDQLEEVIKASEGPVWILGYGTNVLISDKGLAGTVILNKIGHFEISPDGLVAADSGVNWDDIIKKAVELELWGLEFTSGIPGGAGGAVIGNIAAYGHKISDSLIDARILDTASGEIMTWDNQKLGFDYRSSALQRPENKQLAVLSARFQLSRSPTGELEYESALKTASELSLKPDSLANRRQIIIETRRRAGSLFRDNQTGPWTAGSFFKNPLVSEDQIQSIISHEETGVSREQLLRQNVIHGGSRTRVSAAHVLLAAGFRRGQSWGRVRLHPNHILKVENAGGAAAQEIYDVVQYIVETVRQTVGVNLEPEVRFLGEF